MKTWKFRAILHPDGWKGPVWIQTDEDGVVQSISEKDSGSVNENVEGFLLPGFQNAHSHAFQYAMAGVAEAKPGQSDDFWSWRETMYKIALSINPDQMESIASMLYSEMLVNGYTHVTEFHYLHHDEKGKPYLNPAEMGERLCRAAEKTGIRITLVPIFYQRGGFGKEPSSKQRRFISQNAESYLKLWESYIRVCARFENCSPGTGAHSLRAVAKEDLIDLVEKLPDDLPFHIHVSEQQKEVSESESYLGARPVRWILDNLAVDDRYNFVHATHLDDSEVEDLAKCEGRVVLCPTTEGNLGDGLFRFMEFQGQGGSWTIGSDSHIGLSPWEELRILDYGQRLHHHRRDIFAKGAGGAFRECVLSGRKANGIKETEYFVEGKPLDGLVISGDSPLLGGSGFDTLLDTLIYTTTSRTAMGTLIDGEWVVKHGKHQSEEMLNLEFGKAMKEIGIR